MRLKIRLRVYVCLIKVDTHLHTTYLITCSRTYVLHIHLQIYYPHDRHCSTTRSRSIYIYIHTYIPTYMSTHMYIHICTYLHACNYTCMNMSASLSMYVYIWAGGCIYIYACVYVHVCVRVVSSRNPATVFDCLGSHVPTTYATFHMCVKCMNVNTRKTVLFIHHLPHIEFNNMYHTSRLPCVYACLI